MKRRKFQRLANGMFRWQGVDPVTEERLSKSAATERELDVIVDEIERRGRDVRHGIARPDEAAAAILTITKGPPTVKEAWDTYMLGKRGKWQRQGRSVWRHRISPMLGALYVHQCTKDIMLAWEDANLRGIGVRCKVSRRTVQNCFDCLKAAFNGLITAKRIQSLPWADYAPPAPVEGEGEREACRDIDEVVRLVNAAVRYDIERGRGGAYSDLCFRIGYGALTGLRQGEMSGLGWDAYEPGPRGPNNEETLIMTVRYQALDGWQKEHPDWTRPMDPPKGRSERRIRRQKLHGAAVQILHAIHEKQVRHGIYRPDGPVFPSTRTLTWRTHADAIDPDLFRRIVMAAGLGGNLDDWTVHSLRHSFATIEAIFLNGDLKALMDRTGHRDVRTVLGYMHKGGRGLLSSRVPDVPLSLPPATPRSSFAGDVLDVTPEAAREYEAKRTEEKRQTRREWRERYLGRGQCDYTAALREWNAAGRPGERPAAVTEAAERARDAAVQRVKREADEPDLTTAEGRAVDARVRERARRAGIRAHRATIAGWARFLKTADRKTDERAVGEATE